MLYLTYHRVWVYNFHDAYPFNRPFFLQTPYVRLIFLHRLFELKSLHYLSRFDLYALAPTNQPACQRFPVLRTSFTKFHGPYPRKQCEKRISLQPPYLGGFRQYSPSYDQPIRAGAVDWWSTNQYHVTTNPSTQQQRYMIVARAISKCVC